MESNRQKGLKYLGGSMKMNTKMSELLGRTDVPVTFADHVSLETPKLPSFTIADGSVLLKDEYERAGHADEAIVVLCASRTA